MKPSIDNEFYGLIDPPTSEELNILEESIKKEGCRDPLVIWKEKEILLDGHNRFEICTRLDIDYDVKFLSFKTREDAADWIDANQMGRRNLTEIQKSVIRGRRYNRTKGKPGDNQHIKERLGTPCTTSKDLAKEYNVSDRTIKNDGKVADAVESLTKKLGLKQSDVTAKEHTKKDIIAAAEVVEDEPEKAKQILSGATVCQQLDAIENKLSENSGVKVCIAFFMETQSLALKAFAPRIMKTLNDEGKKTIQKNFKKWLSDMETYQDLFIKNAKEIEK